MDALRPSNQLPLALGLLGVAVLLVLSLLPRRPPSPPLGKRARSLVQVDSPETEPVGYHCFAC
jgi:hypothetical protein